VTAICRECRRVGHQLLKDWTQNADVDREPSKTVGSPMPWQSNIPNSHGWKPTLITLQELAIHYGAANLEQEVRSSFTPAHMLTLT
jgi:hypothetical protein